MKKLYFPFLLFYFVFFISGAQDNPLSSLYPPSPNATNLGVISQVQTGGNTGTANYSIPIYSVKEGSLSLPISLEYSSNGVKPNQLPSWVGRGWNLQAGGVITRVVKSKLDITPTLGFCWNSDDVKDYIDGKITNANDQLDLLKYSDLEPDEFFFNFAGFVGTFYRNNDKQREGDGFVNMKFETVPHYNFKYEIISDMMSIQQIKITVDDGTQYFFGGSGCIETTTSVDLEGNVSSEQTAWYLKKIVSQNNDIIQFFYSDKYPINVKKPVEFNYEMVEESSGNRKEGFADYFIESTISSIFLERIKTSTADIVFTNVEHRFSMHGDSSFTRRLDNIEVFNNNDLTTPLKRFQFLYKSANYPLVLYKLQESTSDVVLSPYVFDYYDFGKLPPFYTTKIDHWGFFNGENNLTDSFIPEEVTLPDGSIVYPQREPNSSVLHYDMLKTVTHPLGGEVTFEYEPNSYVFSGSIAGNSFNYATHSEKEGCGLRVSKISFSGDEFSSEINRSYDYVNGILYMKPVYTATGIIDFHFHLDFSYAERNSSSFTPLGAKPITYEKVIEIYSNNSRKESTYSTSLQYPDRLYGYSNESFIKRAISKFDVLRGKLKREVFYDNTDMLKEVVYNYTDYNSSYIYGIKYVKQTSQSALPEAGYWYNYYVYTGAVKLSEKITTSFFETGPVRERETYDYTQNDYEAEQGVLFLKRFCSFGSGGERYCKVFQYPTSIHSGVYLDMVNKNMLSSPIETIELNGENVIGAKLIKYYTTVYNHITPRSVFKLKNSSIPLDYFVHFKGDAIMDPRYNKEPELAFLNHDEKSNVLNYRSIEKGETSILWNNNKTLPIAVVDNCHNEFVPFADSGTLEEIDLGVVGLSNHLSVDVFGSSQKHKNVYTLLEGIKIDDVNDYVSIRLEYFEIMNERSNWLYFQFVNEDTGEVTYSSMGFGHYPDTRDVHLSFGTYTLRMYFYTDPEIDSKLDLNVKLFNYLIGSSSKCFFEDFEEYPDKANLRRSSKTGYFSYKGVYSLPSKSIVPGDYRLSYWSSTDGLRWNHTERAISVGATDILIGESSMYIDDVRVFPEGARMTTYTYDPLIGMTSQTDMNNITRYYDYDSFGRLIGERDFNMDIVNATRYIFANNGYNPQIAITHQTSDGRITYSVSGIDDQTGFSIDFGDGGVESGKTWGYYLYPTKGEYNIVMSTSHPVYGDAVKSKVVRFTENMSSSMSVTINGGSISCSATAYLDSYFYPLVSYRWSFGDGSSSYGQYPTHSYEASGTYMVRCTVSNQFFGSTTHEEEVSVIVGDPKISATWIGGNDFVCWPCNGSGSPEFITLELHAEGVDLSKALVFYQYQRCAGDFPQYCQFYDYTPWEEVPLVGVNYVEFNVCDIESARAEKYRGRFRVLYNGISYYSNIYEGEGFRPCL